MFEPQALTWVRAFHLIFMVCWFAGLFYLPRLFVNHAMVEDAATRERLSLMERKLYRFVTPFAWLTGLFGTWLLVAGWSLYSHAVWMHLKLVLVAGLVVFHIWCGRFVRVFAEGRNVHGHRFFRWFNELPVFVLFGAIILVKVKPF